MLKIATSSFPPCTETSAIKMDFYPHTPAFCLTKLICNCVMQSRLSEARQWKHFCLMIFQRLALGPVLREWKVHVRLSSPQKFSNHCICIQKVMWGISRKVIFNSSSPSSLLKAQNTVQKINFMNFDHF